MATHNKIGKLPFQQVSPNVIIEPPLDVSSKEEGRVESPYFTESGLLSLLGKAIDMLKKSELYELCINLFNIVVSVHQKNREYEKLTESYTELSSICKKLHTLDVVKIKFLCVFLYKKTNPRFFASYYRVGFYGNIFGDLSGVEFVYKEIKGTILPEFVERLKKQLEAQYNNEIVVLANGPEEPEISKLDSNKLYLQVISLQPFFESIELQSRPTLFDQRFDINTFIYEVPFAKTGSAQSEDIADQCKQKVIIQSELKFPYLKKRLKVIKKRKIVLSPLENAIEIIEGRNSSLLHELNSNPPDIKQLQAVLHGSVLARVNVGPVRICDAFLGNADKFPEHQIRQLRDSMNNFLMLCARSVEVNGRFIKEDPMQKEFQAQLEQGYREIKAQIMGKYTTQAHVKSIQSMNTSASPAPPPRTPSKVSVTSSANVPNLAVPTLTVPPSLNVAPTQKND
jgi:hypothetical protein